jgi:predicted TIM-barrel fold metal-dependent hydrolase
VPDPSFYSRRDFLGALSLLSVGAVIGAEASPEPIIDIHQHTNYSGRTDEQLIAHQRAMGVTTTVLLPAGKWYGLDAQCGGNDTVVNLAARFPKQYFFFANEIPYLTSAKEEITTYLKRGAIGIGEQKFRVLSDSGHLHKIAEIAREFKVPILLHFQATDYNLEIQRFHKTLEKFPDVNFIGHAQTFWGNIDKEHQQEVMYPTGKVTPGGITDRLLSDYPNMYGDMSAGSGLNAITRDEDHYRGFMERHQDKLMFGSDCNDVAGSGLACQGAQTIAAIRRLAPSKEIERKLLFENASKLLRI